MKPIPIPNSPGYFADKDGNIYSTRRHTVPKKLQGYRYRKGYIAHSIYSGLKVNKLYFAHHLVLLAFVGEKPHGYHCAHLNGIPWDNRLSNLKYCTVKENHSHKIAHGTHYRGQKHYKTKLTDRLVREILLSKRNHQSTAKQYGVSVQIIKRIRGKRSWRHI